MGWINEWDISISCGIRKEDQRIRGHKSQISLKRRRTILNKQGFEGIKEGSWIKQWIVKETILWMREWEKYFIKWSERN